MPNKNWKLYKTVEWKEKSNEIQKLDGHQCQWCSRSYEDLEDGNFLVVHHKYYIDGQAPWEYPDNDVYITLCNQCHKEYHKIFSAASFGLDDYITIWGDYTHRLTHKLSPSFLISDPGEWVEHHLAAMLDSPKLKEGKNLFFNKTVTAFKLLWADET